MPARRGDTPTIFEGAMSRFKRLSGFQTSGVFGFRQRHTPNSRQASRRAPDRPPGSHRLFGRGIGSDEDFTANRVRLAPHLSLATTGQSGEQSAVRMRRSVGADLLSLCVIEQPLH